MKRFNMSRRRTLMCVELITYNVEGVGTVVRARRRANGRQDGAVW